MHEIFTPRTLFLYRKKIIDQFKKVMGDIDPNIEMSQKGSTTEEDPDMVSSDDDLAVKLRQKKEVKNKDLKLKWV